MNVSVLFAVPYDVGNSGIEVRLSCEYKEIVAETVDVGRHLRVDVGTCVGKTQDLALGTQCGTHVPERQPSTLRAG